MTDFSVDTTPAATPVGIPSADEAPKSTALRSLAAVRAEIQDKLYIDLSVPRYSDPEIWVRFGPASLSHLDNAIERRGKTKNHEPDWATLANCDILASACVGIYACLPEDADLPQEDRTKYSLRVGDENGKWTKFDPDLVVALGVSPAIAPDAATAARSLYLTDGDLVAAANDVIQWSSKASQRGNEDF